MFAIDHTAVTEVLLPGAGWIKVNKGTFEVTDGHFRFEEGNAMQALVVGDAAKIMAVKSKREGKSGAA